MTRLLAVYAWVGSTKCVIALVSTCVDCGLFVPKSFSFKISAIECECYAEGSYSKSCDVDGKCLCKPPYTGDKCDQSKTKFLIAAGAKKTKTEIIDPLIDNFTCQDKIKPFPFTL